jgi:hypothetical protein
MLKKLKLNIEYIGGKTKRRYKCDLTGLPKKIIKLPKAKWVKSKKYCKESYRISTQIHNALALD